MCYRILILIILILIIIIIIILLPLPTNQVAYLRHEESHVSIVRRPFLPFIKNTIPEPDDLTAFSKGRSLYQLIDRWI